MGQSLASIDGVIRPIAEATVSVTDPAVLVGWSVFETLRSKRGQVERLAPHLDRLRASAVAACIAPPDPERLRADVVALAAAHGGDGRLRITLTGGGRCLITVTDVDPHRFGAPVRCVRGPHRDEPFLGGAIKHGSRAPWIVAVARSGKDDVLLVDEAGRFTEGTSCAVLAVIDGVLWTAPDDGRILASTTVQTLIERARAAAIPVRREGPPAQGPFDALYVASVTRGLAPVIELDGQTLPGWDPVGRRLASEG
jgi:branched-chain amino acid aminotransferase